MRWPPVEWESPVHRFIFIVDCQVLQRIVCGHTALHTDFHMPLFVRILEHLKWIFEKGLLPPRLVDDPILWVKRDVNKLADYLANVTMDRKRSWKKERSIDMPAEYNWFAVSDGGARPQCSACGWAVGICYKKNNTFVFEPLVVGGEFLVPRVNSFLAEALALERAAEEMRLLISHHSH